MVIATSSFQTKFDYCGVGKKKRKRGKSIPKKGNPEYVFFLSLFFFLEKRCVNDPSAGSPTEQVIDSAKSEWFPDIIHMQDRLYHKLNAMQSTHYHLVCERQTFTCGTSASLLVADQPCGWFISLLLSLWSFSKAISAIACSNLVDINRRYFPRFDNVATLVEV